ncbi:MAG: FHA domain-containing protein [Myxococcales bacterium]|nr:FHA domain-containing protein [Myxococcales bacterium]
MPVWPGVVAGVSGLLILVWWLLRRPLPGCACGRCRRRVAIMPRCVLCTSESVAELEFRTGPMGGRTIVLEEQMVTIGSVANDGTCAEIVLSDPAVSQSHLRIEREAESYTLRDLGSTNGTYVNGLHHKKLVLCDNDIILIGNSEAVFRIR